MNVRTTSLSLLLSAALLASPGVASAAEFCIQLSTANGNANCDFTGDAGFFRFFRATLPRNARKATALHGRNAGITAVYGTAVRDSLGDQ